MSNENCGFPGIWMAFTHLVWMLAGSAGVNTQSAAALVGDSATALNITEGIAQYASNLERTNIDVPPFCGSSFLPRRPAQLRARQRYAAKMSPSNKLMAKVPRCLFSEIPRSGNTFLFRDIRANGSRFWFWNYARSVVKYVRPFRRLKCRCRFPDSKIRKSRSAADCRYKRLQTKGKKSGRSVSLYDVCHESYAARLRAATKTTVSGVTSKKP